MWNYRIVRIDNGFDEHDTYLLAEVYYDNDDRPQGYCRPFTTFSDVTEIETFAKRVNEALSKEILDESSFFNND